MHPYPVPFPFSPPVRRMQRREIGRLQRVGQHRWPENRRVGRIGLGSPTLQPREQRQVRRLQPVPDLLHIVGADDAHLRHRDLGKRDLGQTSRRPDPQPAGDQLEQRQSGGSIRTVEPTRNQPRNCRLGRRLKRLHNLRQARWHNVSGRRGPDQRYRFSQIADIVVRPFEQHRISARRGQFADQRRFGRGERQLSGYRSQTDAPIRIGLRGKISPQQRDLGVAGWRENQTLQQIGECDHTAACWADHSETPVRRSWRSPPTLSGIPPDQAHCDCRPRLVDQPSQGRSVAQPGSASVWGTGGRGFESRRSDQSHRGRPSARLIASGPDLKPGQCRAKLRS